MKRYLLSRYQVGGMGHGARSVSVIEIANDAEPPEEYEAYQVAEETPLSDWRPVHAGEALPAPLESEEE